MRVQLFFVGFMKGNSKMKALLEVEHVGKVYKKGTKKIRVVNDISFKLYPGQVIGIVGESGCGKSTLAKMITRIIRPDEGRIIFDDYLIFDGKEKTALKSRENLEICRSLQMIFQDPYSSLNPKMNVLEIVGEGMLKHGLCSKKNKEEKVSLILDQCGLGKDSLYKYPHEFSGGQRQRISIARAIAIKPKLIICDEPTAALDVLVQNQILNLMQALKDDLGLSYIFISHNLNVINYFSDRVLVMYRGEILEIFNGENQIHQESHPYTEQLYHSMPMLYQKSTVKGELRGVEGASQAEEQILGCCFADQCPYKKAECLVKKPALKLTKDGRYIACHFRHRD